MMCHHSKEHVRSACPITGDVSFDHLVKVASAGFLHNIVTLIPLSVFFSLDANHEVQPIFREGGRLSSTSLSKFVPSH